MPTPSQAGPAPDPQVEELQTEFDRLCYASENIDDAFKIMAAKWLADLAAVRAQLEEAKVSETSLRSCLIEARAAALRAQLANENQDTVEADAARARLGLRTNTPAVMAVMGSQPACAEWGCQLLKAQQKLAELMEWRDSVTLALRREAGTLFNDVPQRIRDLKDDADGWMVSALTAQQEITRLKELLAKASATNV